MYNNQWPWFLSGWYWIVAFSLCIILGLLGKWLSYRLGRKAIEEEHYKAGLLNIKGKEGIRVGRKVIIAGEMLFWFGILFMLILTIRMCEVIFNA